MNDEDRDIDTDNLVKYRVLISDSWVDVGEEAWEAWPGARCIDASDANGPTIYDSGR